MDIKDLFYALREYRGDTYEALEDLKALESMASTSPKKLALRIKLTREDAAVENEMCPRCHSETEVIESGCEISDCQGEIVKEIMHEVYCPNCKENISEI